MRNTVQHIIVLLVLALQPLLADAASNPVYDKTCAMCHANGVAGAPRLGNADDWGPRIARGVSSLYTSALQGTAKGMPPKGGGDYTDAEIKGAVDFMVAKAKAAQKPAATARTPAAKAPSAKEPPKEAAKETSKETPKETAKAAESAPATVAAAPASAGPAVSAAPTPSAAGTIPFNRLLKPKSKANPPPAEDGIHDPTNDGTLTLQPPQQGLAGLPPSPSGNHVNWVEAINNKSINPRYDRVDANAEPIVMDLNIVREVKGSMPDVVYPHKQHTQWLDCSNCHPAIFIPQKGANQISMAAILMGQKCGVCHGKVAFPVSECRRCHSKKKDIPATAAAEAK